VKPLLPALVLAASALVASALTTRAQDVQPTDVAAGAPCANLTPRELIVAYDVTGGTLTGPVDLHLSVYSDGSARLSSSLGDGLGSSQHVHLDPAVTTGLVQGLIGAGAMTHCDVPDFLSDVPLSTLTVLRGPARKRANSFSWTGGDDEIAVMQALLNTFVADHFLPVPGGKNS
jgi:hypothetical protein